MQVPYDSVVTPYYVPYCSYNSRIQSETPASKAKDIHSPICSVISTFSELSLGARHCSGCCWHYGVQRRKKMATGLWGLTFQLVTDSKSTKLQQKNTSSLWWKHQAQIHCHLENRRSNPCLVWVLYIVFAPGNALSVGDKTGQDPIYLDSQLWVKIIIHG